MKTRNLVGLDHALRTFDRLPREANEAITDALNKGAAEIEARAKTLAPVRTGRLRDSIRSNIGSRLGRVFAEIGVFDYRAGWIEFGTVNRAAQPFFWPAVRGVRKRVTNRVKRQLRLAAREVARGNR